MRLAHLDGLRGLAIALVLSFHAYAGWTGQVPYGAAYADIGVFKFGWLGVELFFLISGFVIFMTLDKTASFGVFLYKRWVRLFPAMLLASALIVATAPWLIERPNGAPTLLGLLPGLSFIEPRWWGFALHTKVVPLEGAFWSLYVEFKFYLIAGAVYYLAGRRSLVPVLGGMFALSALLWLASAWWQAPALALAYKGCTSLSFNHFGWFACGAAFYRHEQARHAGDPARRWWIAAVALALASALFVRDFAFDAALGAGLIGLVFLLAFVSAPVRRIAQTRLLLWLGFVSYPLYLIHENALIALIVKTHFALPWLPDWLDPALPIVGLCAVAWLIAARFETRLRAWLAPARRGSAGPAPVSRVGS